MSPEDEAFEELSRRQGDWGLQGSRKHQIMRYAENVESKRTSMTPQQIDAMKLALEALELWSLMQPQTTACAIRIPAITAIKQTLKEHAMRETQRLGQEIEQEPVAWWNDTGTHIDLNVSGRGAPLYTTPPQRKPLTDEMKKQMRESCDSHEMRGAFVDGWLSAEAAHGIWPENSDCHGPDWTDRDGEYLK